jgi:uncharacterized protein YndB with AHSA1/START domain
MLGAVVEGCGAKGERIRKSGQGDARMKTTEITVAKTIPATAEEVYEAWLDPKSPGGPWFGAADIVFQPEVRGLFYFAVKHAGREWAHYGRFTKLEPAKAVEYTWMSEATKGLESVVTVTLEARGEDTEVTLRHAGVPDDEMGHEHKQGWAWTLNMLAEKFGKRR